MTSDSSQPTNRKPAPDQEEIDVVQEASPESFPANDPPTWRLSKVPRPHLIRLIRLAKQKSKVVDAPSTQSPLASSKRLYRPHPSIGGNEYARCSARLHQSIGCGGPPALCLFGSPGLKRGQQHRIALGSNDIKHATQLIASVSDMAAHLGSAQ